MAFLTTPRVFFSCLVDHRYTFYSDPNPTLQKVYVSDSTAEENITDLKNLTIVPTKSIVKLLIYFISITGKFLL